ncbi:Alpha/Beta hydrolase protein [Crucibulum laeve]|uniref:Carboxylic ester hydrolase n=1 Tax=Crucibulum laeve TaxID=68775 RepID=A0A5C3LSJ3_9AGAR|nr:Alpha/Beta hydrolase protein [Crucibulum laeve]
MPWGRLFGTFSLLTTLGFTIKVYASTVPDVVDLGYAKYQGFVNKNTSNTEFLGIRFAAAPTGALRWREPQTPSSIAGIQQANAFPNACLQAGEGGNAVNPFRIQKFTVHSLVETRSNLGTRATAAPSEDCLFLNVFIPNTLNKDRNLPVVVWIHSGGYSVGSSDMYNGNDLIRESGAAVVVVTIQYRLGVFGFLSGQKVKDNGLLNAGLLDQQFALKWVQQHIKKFGGDPAKVTIWGESAGAGSVLQHIVANGGRTEPSLFRGAISSSLYFPPQYQFNDPILEANNSIRNALFSEVSSQTGCASASDTMTCLRAVNPAVLQNTNVNITSNAFFGTFIFVPVVDGTFITHRPTELLKEGRVNGEALLAVTNVFEGATFVDASIASTIQIDNFAGQLFPHFGTKEMAATATQYQGIGAPLDQAIAIMGESIFICPTYTMLSAFTGRSFKGEFAVPPAIHGTDVIYYFPSTPVLILAKNKCDPRCSTNNNTAFDKSFSESFLNFAMSLNPNVKWDSTGDITQLWNTWNGDNEMLFTEVTPMPRSYARSTHLKPCCNVAIFGKA